MDPDAPAALARALAEREGALNILVNNAGAMRNGALADATLDDWDTIMDVNVRAVFFLTRELLPLLRAAATPQDPARIVNTGSVLGPLGRAKLHAYCGSKSAIIGLTRSLAAELGKEKINVNCVCPGYFLTEINQNLQSRPGYIEAINGVTPMERWGDPKEMVGTIIYLSSAASSYVTGQTIMVDGGLSSSFKFQLAA